MLQILHLTQSFTKSQLYISASSTTLHIKNDPNNHYRWRATSNSMHSHKQNPNVSGRKELWYSPSPLKHGLWLSCLVHKRPYFVGAAPRRSWPQGRRRSAWGWYGTLPLTFRFNSIHLDQTLLQTKNWANQGSNRILDHSFHRDIYINP